MLNQGQCLKRVDIQYSKRVNLQNTPKRLQKYLGKKRLSFQKTLTLEYVSVEVLQITKQQSSQNLPDCLTNKST